ncbi:MAG: hypothetical protein HUJ73_01795 [Eubacterium sp.]|nr:hypothetical protein [Eubacterium sp.]
MDISGNLKTISETFSAVLLVGSILTAAAQCFFGFRFVRFWVSFAGVVLGLFFGFMLWKNDLLPKELPVFVPILIMIAIGVVLGFLANRLMKVGVFIFCGFVASNALSMTNIPQDGIFIYLYPILQVIVFLLVGFIAVRFMRTAIILVTSIGGAWTVAKGLAELLPQYINGETYMFGVFALMAAAGILIQFLTTKNKK